MLSLSGERAFRRPQELRVHRHLRMHRPLSLFVHCPMNELLAQVFENDFPALKTDPLPLAPPETGMFESQPVRGRCKVICFHPRHDLTLARMSVEDVVRVVEGWKGIYREEGEMLRAGSEEGAEGKGEGYVQIFEVGVALGRWRVMRWWLMGEVESGIDDGG